jgi:hypothetical protein
MNMARFKRESIRLRADIETLVEHFQKAMDIRLEAVVLVRRDDEWELQVSQALDTMEEEDEDC